MVSTMTNAEQVKIPEGYKQTEVGVIPSEWESVEIRDICSISVGKDVDPNYSSEEDSKYCYPVFSNTVDIPGIYGYYDYAEYTGSVVTVVGRGVGLGTAICRNGGFGAIGRLIVLFPKEGVSNQFLANYINNRIDVFSESSGVPQLTGIALGNYMVALPPPKEQTAIANALSDVDSLIASLETLISKKSAIKTAAMQQLLTGKKRLPAFAKESEKKVDGQGAMKADRRGVQETETQGDQQGSDQLAGSGATNQATQPKTSKISVSLTQIAGQTASRPGYKQTELGEIPEDWEVVGLGCLFEDKVTRRRISGEDEITFIGMQDVSETAKICNSHKVKFTDIKSGFTYFERNDVLVAKITPCFENGKGAYTDILETEIGFGSTEFHVLRATPNTDSKYLYYFTNTEKFRKELEGEMVGSAGHRRVPLSSIQSYQVAISKNKEEQTAIANILSNMDTELDALQQRLDKNQKIKQGMMQELLTGKTRLV